MTANLVKLTSCRNAIEAETLRNRLETAGIMAVVQGAEVGTALSYLGTAIGCPNIEVDSNDLERAKDLLAADRVALETVGDWTCSRCGEFNEPAFEVCWSCNKTRSDEDPPGAIAPEDYEAQESFDEVESLFSTTPTNRSTRNPANPYQAPDFGSDVDSTPIQSHHDSIDSDYELINRAFIAAIFGGFMPIMIFTIYSLSILIPLSLSRPPIIYTRSMKFYGAWAINLLVTGLVLAMLLS
jgi:hypothetical protein